MPIGNATVGSGRALNKLKWDRKDGRRTAIGSSDGRLYIYDIGDIALPRESEWTDLQRTIANLNPAGAVSQMVVDPATSLAMGGTSGLGSTGSSAAGSYEPGRSVYR